MSEILEAMGMEAEMNPDANTRGDGDASTLKEHLTKHLGVPEQDIVELEDLYEEAEKTQRD